MPTPKRLIASAFATALLVVACGGSAAVTGPPTVPSPAASSAPGASSVAASTAPTAAPSPTPVKGPPTGTFGLVGTLGLKGQFSASSISCNYPTPDGSEIIAFGQIGTNGPFVQVFVTPGSALVRADTGSGATFKMRTFTGPGVTGFDGATGAKIDTPLTENTDKSLSTTGIGAISSITGTVDCGNQTAGTSTITVTGLTPQGQLAGPLTLAKVTCNILTTGAAAGTYVDVAALGQIGTTTVMVNITTGVHQVTFFESSALGQTFFSDYKATGATISGRSVHVSADVSQQTAASPPPSGLASVHVEGDATCGT